MPSLADVVANPTTPMPSLADGMISNAASTKTTTATATAFYNDMVVDGVRYKQWLVNARSLIGMEVGEKLTVKQGKGRSHKTI